MPALTLRSLAAAAALLLGAGPAAAERLTICNHDDLTKLYATVQIGNFQSLLPNWMASGWYTLEPGRCDQVSTHLGRTYVFFSMLTRATPDTKPWIAHYPVARIGSLATHPPGSYGVEAFLCAKADRFSRVRATLPEHADCPEGYDQRLFNLLVIVDGSELTLNID